MAVSHETWPQMHAVNLDAGFHLARELARELIAAKMPGSFLLLTSLHAGTPRNLPHYSTAKAGMAMLVKELAKTFGRYGIRVNALVPGAIAAGGFVADPSLAKHIPLGRLGQAEDLAPMALAVLSNRVSAYVTGAAIVVDGGLSLTNWFEPPEFGEIWDGTRGRGARRGTRGPVRPFSRRPAAHIVEPVAAAPTSRGERHDIRDANPHHRAADAREARPAAIAQAAQNAIACERKGEAEEAREWRHVEDAMKMMRGPHQG